MTARFQALLVAVILLASVVVGVTASAVSGANAPAVNKGNRLEWTPLSIPSEVSITMSDNETTIVTRIER